MTFCCLCGGRGHHPNACPMRAALAAEPQPEPETVEETESTAWECICGCVNFNNKACTWCGQEKS